MTRAEQVQWLIERLLEEMPDTRVQAARVSRTEHAQRQLLRGLMNLRPPMPLAPDFLKVQDALLSAEREERSVVDVASLPEAPGRPGVVLWQGDITRLKVDAIVNAANSALLGCFHPCHGCIDNAIHSAAGLQLRDECARLMNDQGHSEPTGRAKLTKGYNLPARYVLHTVGPVVQGEVTAQDRAALAECYCASLTLAAERGLESVAFCCISTGEFHFPNQEAARIAVDTVSEFLQAPGTIKKVIFNVFKDMDAELYRALLGTN